MKKPANNMQSVIYVFLFVSVIFMPVSHYAQCPQLNDGNGNPSNNPYWVHCINSNYTLNISSPDNIGAWSIDWGDSSPVDTGSSLISPATISHIYIATVDTFVVTFTETSTGCIITGVVVMEEYVNSSIQIPVGGVTQICAPDSMAFINSSTNVSSTTTFTWDFGDGSPVEIYDYTNVGQTISHAYQKYTVNCQTQVTLTADNYCTQQAGAPTIATFNPIMVWDTDDAQINPSATVLCDPDSLFHFDNTTNKNCIPQGNTSQRYENWNFGDYWGLGYDSIINWLPFDPPTRPGYDIAFPGIGTYTTMLIDSNLCGQDTAYQTVNIVGPPTAGLAATPDTICAGESITFTNLSTGGATSFDWNFGDGTGWSSTGSGSQTHTYNISGDFTVTLVAHVPTNSAICADTVTIIVSVLPSPQSGFTLSDSVGCDTLTVAYADASFSAIAWNWDFGNGNTSTLQNPPSQFYPSPNNYTVSLAVTGANSCTDTAQNTVNVFQSPVANFFPMNVCENTLASFFDSSTSSVGDPIISWSWDFGDGGTSTTQNPTHQYADSGTYTIILSVATANCTGSGTFPVTVEPKPTAAFLPDTTSGCPVLTVSFTNNSTDATIYSWNFGDGVTSTQTNPTHQFTNTGTVDSTYNVMLAAQTAFGCADTTYQNITVFPVPDASFTHDAILDCAPLLVNFISSSTGATSYLWDFGDGTTDTVQNPTHIFNNQTLFIDIRTTTLTVTSANGCTDSASQTITVYPEPVFTFSAIPDSGCSPLTVSFPSVIGAVAYQWDFGDGNTGTGSTPSHTYYNATTNSVTYIVQLIATNSFGCNDTSYENVKVMPKPSAQFNVDTAVGCQPFPVAFTNSSTGAVNFDWDFGDGDTSDTSAAVFTHIYTNTTGDSLIYSIELVVETQDGCLDTAYRSVLVYPEVIAAFTSDTSGCSPVSIIFSNQSAGATSYNWDFGDGNNSAANNPTNTFVNNGTSNVSYTTTLIAQSPFGCYDTTQGTIIVHPSPTASFTATPTTQVYPSATVSFTNNSSAGTWQYDWDFGDAQTSSSPNPSPHIYTTWGTYTISLLVYSAYCADSITQTVVIEPPLPIAGFIGSDE
ncbi:PKD domain-containing protein, partial [Bacteroidales bacterium AH-315-I05]|nr:PKD domain-containing protein [Bacteroidales bacterium AH-315-I05]